MSNVEIADTLNLSQSTVSRMRSGSRVASAETLQAIVDNYNVNASVLLTAATKASQGDPREWVELLARVFDDGEPDPEAEVDAIMGAAAG